VKWIKNYEPNLSENYIEIHYRNMNKEIEDIIRYLESKKILIGKNETKSRFINIDEIFYCEIVDRKCYAYLKEEVWRLQEGLSELTEQYEINGFIRISKSMVVNIYKVKKIEADFNMRMNLVLMNGETVVMSRNYRNDFFRRLKNIRMEERNDK